ncbi:AI-2E family transporter [Bacillus spizizenii]|uniref:AI-2E family transporter n=2 Tax=Bacillus spizizenii TaxID=96241 RepID=A0A9Q4DNG2_BACSC|nr:AI-2E family transporter [Bacillus spizizenii]KFI02053.1 membrane protein [Bacillus sp. BSC154]MDU7575556.1 AI-2E family transporter [Bacillus subtilis]ADM39063.1 putative integral inner membrane protein [Bacillus spizizenii str. W23]AJW84582.1 membrane protein [Bacillus spizizenii]EFG92183.1 putative integral inner membrane protein [Bacillus spizizenii ATCC 6633 = JCM 2499]
MEMLQTWSGRFKRFFLDNKFVLFLLVLLLIGLNILVFTKTSFIFTPIIVLLKTISLPIILTGIVFYLLNPIVDFLERRRIRRIYSILLLYLLIIGLITITIVSIIPFLKEQIMSLIDNIPRYVDVVENQTKQLIGSNFVNQAQQTMNINISDLATKVSDQAATIVNSTFTGVGNFIGALTEIIISIVTVPFILFYLLKDGKKLPVYILKFVPTRLKEQTYTVLSEMNHRLSSYIRGQIIVSFCIGFLLFIGYLIIGLDYASLLAVIAACTSIVPYLGPTIAITPAIIIAIVTSPLMLLKLVIVWTIVQLIEGKLISPQIMGKNLHIHPITIIFLLLTAGKLFGVVGIILAIPGYAVAKVITTHLFDWFKMRSHLYDEEKNENTSGHKV